jgi:glycerol-3-phosphate acyltransferase PlsY
LGEWGSARPGGETRRAFLAAEPWTIAPAALGAFLGATFPVSPSFKGGKGVATYIGVLLALAWTAAIVFCLIWLAVGY